MPVTKLVTVLIFAIFWPRHPKKGAPELPVGELRAHRGTNSPLRPAKSVLVMRMTPLTLNFSLNLAIMRYVPTRLWLRTDEMSVLVQDRRGQRDPRKRPRARGAIMARPRCKPHRPFYFLWGNTASRASGPVVKVAAASRANTPVRKCGVKYQVSWWEQPDIPRNARIVYDTEGRVVDMVRGSLMHTARLGAGTAAVIAVLGLSGCAFNPLSTFTTPTIDQIECETVTPAVSDDALVAPGTLTVALDTSDAPQAMQGTDGELTGYAVDAARALANRMGLKVAFVDASSVGSALGDKKADIFIGEINSTDGDVSSLGTCLYDAASVFGKTNDGGSLNVSTDTLNTSTLGVQMSSASQEALAKQSITANQKTYSNINECFEALESGEVDYVICDSTAGGYLARLMSEISYVGSLEAPSTLGVAGLSFNDELCRAVSDALDGITVDGTLEAVHCVWYGTMPYDLTTKTVSGANLQSSGSVPSGSESSDSNNETASSEDKSSSQEGTITDDDINKLNS